MGSTGATLEKFLNKFNRTVYPHPEVTLHDSLTIPKCRDGFYSIYNTEIAQCYPGKRPDGKGDRPPTGQEITNCLAKGFLEREIELIKPKLVLLMGKASRDSFFSQVLNATYPRSLSEHIAIIIDGGAMPQLI